MFEGCVEVVTNDLFHSCAQNVGRVRGLCLFLESWEGVCVTMLQMIKNKLFFEEKCVTYTGAVGAFLKWCWVLPSIVLYGYCISFRSSTEW